MIYRLFFGILFAYSVVVGANQQWVLEKKIDPLTDKEILVAITSNKLGAEEQTAFVRCDGKKLEVFFGFGMYLGDKEVKIRYRVDKHELIADEWYTSAKGTGVFAKYENSVARMLKNGQNFVLEVTDFRGQNYISNINLTGAENVISPVLDHCKVSQIGKVENVEGLNPHLAMELERWGPKSIELSKKVLTIFKVYHGAIDNDIEPNFALALQSFYDEHLEKYCPKLKKPNMACPNYHDGKPISHLRPLACSVVYERASGKLKKELGKLKINE